MRCERCQGMLVEDHCYDLFDYEISMKAWRCVACGDIVDDVILRNRMKRLAHTAVVEEVVVHASAA